MSFCVYFDCTTTRKISNVSFFRFPKDSCRYTSWVNNCGNPALYDLSTEQLRERRVCALHFLDKDFVNDKRNKLVHDAVPVSYNNSITKVCQSPETLSVTKSGNPKVYGKAATIVSGASMSFRDCSPEHTSTCVEVEDDLLLKGIRDAPTPTRKRKMVQRTRTISYEKHILLKKKIKSQNLTIFRLRKKIAKFRTFQNVPLLTAKSKSVRVFVRIQLAHKRHHPWREDEKQLALSMYYKSPSLYLYMRNELKFVLPSKSTIFSWLRISQLSTGTNTELFKKLRTKVNGMTYDEKQCVLLFDEISIKKGFDYNIRQDLIEGFEDLGHLGRSNRIATQALVFMVRGLIQKWKIPVAYYMSSSAVKHSELHKLILEVIERLHNIGLKVRVITCDQGANNRAAFRTLGVTEENPHFFVNGVKIYGMYDVPHLIKSLRNNLMTKDIYDDSGKITWKDVEQSYFIDKSSETARAAVKISDVHINPNSFQKMRVKYATQIFSNSVSALVSTAAKTGQLKSDSALHTALFLSKINNMFDILNSRTLYSRNPYRCALSTKHKRNENYLQETLSWAKTWRSYGNNNRIKEGIFCFKGFVLSLKTTLLLWTDLQNENYKFLLTSRLNQDPLENLFSVIRSRGGYCAHPSAKAFRQALQFNVFIKLQTPPENVNCEFDEDEIIILNDDDIATSINTSDTEDNIICDLPEVCVSNKNTDIFDNEESVVGVCNNDSEVNGTVEDCAVVYFAGYVTNKTIKKFNCAKCIVTLVNSDSIMNDKNQLLLLERDFSKGEHIVHLKKPEETTINVVKLVLKCFSIHFNSNKSAPKFKQSLLKACMFNVNKHFPNWLDEDDQCYQHHLFLIKHLVLCKLHKSLKWMSQETRSHCSLKRKTILSNA